MSLASLPKEGICKLCGIEGSLENSHVIPSFFFSWLKKTSATGFVRHGTNPNLRKQDGPKGYLLCSSCEDIFSFFEQRFSSKFFYPYVNDILDDESNMILNPPMVPYDEWLLKFVISVQWRSLLLQEDLIKNLEHEKKKQLEELRIKWTDFLLSKSDDCGPWCNYLIPLSNLANADGHFPPQMHPKTNFYILRTADMSLVTSSKSLYLFSKMGPMAFLTSVVPDRLDGMEDLELLKEGNFNFVYSLKNGDVGTFLLVTRPKEAMERHELTESSKSMINKSYASNPERASSSKTAKAQLADFLLSLKRKK